MNLQDGQEFLKLLLSKLEAVFAHSQRQVGTYGVPVLLTIQTHLHFVTWLSGSRIRGVLRSVALPTVNGMA